MNQQPSSADSHTLDSFYDAVASAWQESGDELFAEYLAFEDTLADGLELEPAWDAMHASHTAAEQHGR